MKRQIKSKNVFGNSIRKGSNNIYKRLHQSMVFLVVFVVIGVGLYFFLPAVYSVGLDSVVVSLVDSEATNTDSQVSVAFEVAGLSNGETITIYMGEDTSGDEWQDDGITTSHISCSDDGAGETYTASAVNAATASASMNVVLTATTVGAGATTITCLIGDGGANDPDNPIGADGYSFAVVTTDDAGAGIAYVGDANNVTVSVDMLSNLALTIDNADGTFCTTTSGVTACDLGVVLTTSVVTGNYDVNIGTNATSGATLSLAEDGDLRNGAENINDITEDTGTVTAGSEEYGIAVVADATWTEQGNFTDDDSPVAAGPATVATTAGEIDIAGDDVTITHRAAINSTVKALTYTHIVTWTATANF